MVEGERVGQGGVKPQVYSYQLAGVSHHPPHDALLGRDDLINATAEEDSDPLEVIEHHQLH